MARGRTTIARDSVFGRPASAAPAQGLKEEKKPTQTAVWLSDEETNWLDDQCTKVKRSGWKGITRSALIRAMVQALMEKELDLTGVTGEAELNQRIATSQ